MSELYKTILKKASGESRLDPDQQRCYMGTFRERVLLTLSASEAESSDFQASFADICQSLKREYSPLFLKISPALPDGLQISFMKEAQGRDICTTIVDEKIATTRFALVFHTDHAVNQEDVSLARQFSHLLQRTQQEKQPEKRSFWQALFGK